MEQLFKCYRLGLLHPQILNPAAKVLSGTYGLAYLASLFETKKRVFIRLTHEDNVLMKKRPNKLQHFSLQAFLVQSNNCELSQNLPAPL